MEITTENNPQTLKVIAHNLTFEIHNSIREIKEAWISLMPNNIFYSYEFLTFLEDCPPINYDHAYLTFRREGKIIGGASLQLKHLRLSENLNYKDSKNKWEQTKNAAKKAAARALNTDTLICGNVLLTGEYGFYFEKGSFSHKEQIEIIESALLTASDYFRNQGYNIRVILLKDYYENNSFANSQVTDSQLNEFAVQPNMMLEMREWSSFDDYLSDLKSKYRVRVKRAFKKLGGIEKRELKLEEIKEYNSRIYELYLSTAEVAEFNLFWLPKNYFVKLKEYLGSKVKVVGYFLDDKLICYYTIVISSDHMEAHYLGYDKDYNAKHQLYLNMLFDLVKEGITLQTKIIKFARTALEIKSSIGAVPYKMYCYLMHRSPTKNKMISRALNWFSPKEDWLPREPFKS